MELKLTKDDQLSKIKQMMSLYYTSEAKAEEWLDTEHGLLSDQRLTPRELVEKGNGNAVIEFLEMVFR